jgi:hypothetical protein
MIRWHQYPPHWQAEIPNGLLVCPIITRSSSDHDNGLLQPTSRGRKKWHADGCIYTTAIVDVKGRKNYRERGGAAAYTNVRDGSPHNEDGLINGTGLLWTACT